MPSNNQLSTSSGRLSFVEGVSMRIPAAGGGVREWQFVALPEVSDSKEAQYSDIPILGRSSPIPTFSHSGYRRLQIVFHLHSTSEELRKYHAQFIWAAASLVHPEYEQSYRPPRLAWFKCGTLIGGGSDRTSGGYVRLLTDSVNYTLDPEQVWLDRSDLMPQYVSLSMAVRVVYNYRGLPGANKVLNGNW
jgi:hypothetical protein